MDAGLPVAAVGAISGTGNSRPPAGALPASVATELAPTKAIGATAPVVAAHNPPDNSGAATPTPPALIDPEAREVLYHATDIRRRAATQARAALLRRRAYARAHADATAGAAAVPDAHADIEV